MFVFSNLAISLDGKIATADLSAFYLGTAEDRRQMQVIRKKSDVLLMGAGTLRAHRSFCGVRAWPADRQPANAILSGSLRGVSPTWKFFRDPGLHRLIFLTEKLGAARRRSFEKSCELVPILASRPIAPQIIRALAKRGYRNLLVEGGGGVMWDFASLNLIDEYHVTLTPKIVGGAGAPTLVDGRGFSPDKILGLKLKSCLRIGDELYLVYRKISGY